MSLRTSSKKQIPATSITLIRAFDRNRRYGPFIDIPRLERWHRAQRFGLRPPSIILQLLKRHPELNVTTRDNGREVYVCD